MGMLSLLACLLASTAPAAPAAAWTPDANDPRQRMLAALVEELDRSRKSLMLRGHEAPYFLSYAVRGVSMEEVGAKYGAIFLDHTRCERRLQVDVRVGSYEFDNTGSQEMFDFDGQDSGYSAGREAPLDDDPAALRNALWLLTDDLYKKALSAYLKKKGKEVYRPDDPERPSSFSREEPHVDVMPRAERPFDAEAWKRELRAQSDRLRSHPELFDSQMRAGVDREERELANTEGARLITERVLYGLHVQAWARAPDGMLLEDSRDFYGATEAELPRGEKLSRKIDEMVGELLALRNAPVLDPYTGRAVLAGPGPGGADGEPDRAVRPHPLAGEAEGGADRRGAPPGEAVRTADP